MSQFATNIMNQKYAHDKEDGGKETWSEIAHRVSKHVMKAVNAPKDLVKEIETAIANKEFIPGGRYLYATGRPFKQVQNCFAGETAVVTRHGVKQIKDLAGTTQTLMTSNGLWTEAPVVNFGKQTLMKVTLKRAGVIKEIYSTPEHSWRIAKNYKGDRCINKREVLTKNLKKGMRLWSVYGYGISRTPISTAGVQHGIVYGDGNVPKDEHGFNTANIRLCGEKDSQLLKYFNGYPTRPIESDVEVSGLPRHYKEAPSLLFDRSYLLGWLAGYFAADGCVSKDGAVRLASYDRKSLELVKDVCYLLGIGAYGITSQEKISNLTNEPCTCYYVTLMPHTLTEDFFLTLEHRNRFIKNPPEKAECSWNVVSIEETQRYENVYCAVVPETHEFVLEDNILTGNCLLLRAEDSREGWSDLLQKASMALMTGAGIGVNYSALRAKGKLIRKTGGTASGPIALMQMINECARFIMQGGSRRSAVWAGLSWKHPDIHEFIHIKDWSDLIKSAKAEDYNFPAPLDSTNISVCLDGEFFEAYNDEKHALHATAYSVYWDCIKQMLSTGEPGFSVDVGEKEGEDLRNAPVCGSTRVLTKDGYFPVLDLVGKPCIVWTGEQWASDVVFKKTGDNVPTVIVSMSNDKKIQCDPTHPFLVWKDNAIKRIPAFALQIGDILHTSIPWGLTNDKQGVIVTKLEDGSNEDVFCADVGVEEHSFMAEGVIISNCTEVSSRDDSDICNLGSINMAKVKDLAHMKRLVEIATAYLVAGSVYSDVPYTAVDRCRTKNRRIGLGLMGLHEWLLTHGKKYGPDAELEEYLKVYATNLKYAKQYAKMWDLTTPIAGRAIAPTGTIGIVAETSTGIEPVFCVAYKRRYMKGEVVHYQYVVDPVAQRLINSGVPAEQIEDAYSLAEDVERRVVFQEWIQKYVDHGVSSTINLPEWGSELNNDSKVTPFGQMLIKHLPNLRGITCYPDGARGGQPLTPVAYKTAIKHVGEVFVEQADVCDITKRGSCGS